MCASQKTLQSNWLRIFRQTESPTASSKNLEMSWQNHPIDEELVDKLKIWAAYC